jgi:2-oxoglutarate dehydrogenase E1 component
VVQQYAKAGMVFWVQEEPANMGGWTFVRERLQDLLLPHQKLGYAGRLPSASTAVGSMRLHRAQQQAILDAAFAGLD